MQMALISISKEDFFLNFTKDKMRIVYNCYENVETNIDIYKRIRGPKISEAGVS